MRKLFYGIAGVFAMVAIASCNSSDKKAEEAEGELTPVTEDDQYRYNINAPAEEVINLDTTRVDSTHAEPKP